ncbi:Regulator of chromosome condensation family with FYVE zinc finger domain-containing protein [Perilla frutescens var. hirtella]|uniref:Regulator of chromosome condensation family with FYVE zinc finger domain-containing protein n=1 Tax=Perilla frutescens var. hirtella TaxID=608512 RepID=A0AAD4IML8_PERFH|nr:Regulator of chromosome condensation family with FYVE zinc finger domain-containing protein [Perilla frutescens var. hirtella]
MKKLDYDSLVSGDGRHSLVERDIDQAITALKKGAHLLKYGRRGKPKFCPFRLSTDESTLIWYYGKDEKHLELRHVSRIIPGQRTVIFQRYPRPEKEYQSFSLIYNDRSLDLICKDKDEAEVWFVGLKALIARGSHKKLRNEARSETASSESPRVWRVSRSSSFFSQDHGDTHRPENTSQSRLGKAFAEVLSFTASSKNQLAESAANAPTLQSAGAVENSNARTSGTETIRVSLSSALSSSSQGSCNEDFDNLGDVFIWGEGTGSGVMGGGLIRVDRSTTKKIDALVPKALESIVEAGGRLGHGMGADIFHPKLIETLNGNSIEMVACGDYHTCAVTLSGDLYTWGDGSFNCGLLGHGSNASHWIPKRVTGPIDGLQVSFVSCGPWHTALLTSAGKLFTFGDGTFGALGHGDRTSTSIPREVEALNGFQTEHVACGVWHTAAVVEIISGRGISDHTSVGKLFTWGDGEYGQLGHGDNKPRLVPERISSLVDMDFSQVACGNNLTVALTTAGKVYTMGSTLHGKKGASPTCIKGNIANCCVEEIACGSHHIAVLTSKAEVYTWGKGANGQLGHGDTEDRNAPTLVNFLKEKQVKSIACGSNFTAVICLHKWISSADISVCSGCHNPFNFMRKRHNCYNCGLGYCTTCSTRKSLKASLAPSMNKPFRVCDDCFAKLQKTTDSTSALRIPYVKSTSTVHKSSELTEKEIGIHRWPGSISRLSFAESLKCDRSSSFSVKPESTEHRVFPLQNGNIQRASTSSKSPSSPYGSSPGSLSFFIPDSRTYSQSPSPVPWRSTTPSPSSSLTFRTPEANHDEIRSSNDSLSMELKSLKAQVERLASKSHFLEAELQRKSRQLKEVTSRAADEAEKSKAAKEVIKSLTAQLKEMAERVPEKQVVCSHLDTNDQMGNDTNGPSNGSLVMSKTSPKSESGGSSTAPLSNGTEAQVQKSERTIQDEPGVYITLLSLQNGANELRRVRFSRKHFTEEQAEKWWAEKGRKVCEQHNVRTT